MTKWDEYANRLKLDMEHAKPTISIARVMLLFGVVSKSSAWYILKRLEIIGVVKHVDGKWYLT